MTSLRHNPEPERTPTPDPGRGPADDYLDAARELILEVGWKRSTLTEIARRAGVSRMTIYRTWPDMTTLLADLMTREWRGIAALVAADHPDATPQDIAGSVLSVIAALRGNDLFTRIIEVNPELLLPYLLERPGRSQQAILDVLEQRVRAGQGTGAVRSGDPVAISRGVLLAAHGFALSTQTMTDHRIDDRALDAELRHLVERTLAP